MLTVFCLPSSCVSLVLTFHISDEPDPGSKLLADEQMLQVVASSLDACIVPGQSVR